MSIRLEVALEVGPDSAATVADLRAMVAALDGVDANTGVWLDHQEDGDRAAVTVTWMEENS